MSKCVGQESETVAKMYQKKFYKIKWAVYSKIQNKANGTLYNLTVVTLMEKRGDTQNSFFLIYGLLEGFMMRYLYKA